MRSSDPVPPESPLLYVNPVTFVTGTRPHHAARQEVHPDEPRHKKKPDRRGRTPKGKKREEEGSVIAVLADVAPYNRVILRELCMQTGKSLRAVLLFALLLSDNAQSLRKIPNSRWIRPPCPTQIPPFFSPEVRCAASADGTGSYLPAPTGGCVPLQHGLYGRTTYMV